MYWCLLFEVFFYFNRAPLCGAYVLVKHLLGYFFPTGWFSDSRVHYFGFTIGVS